MFAQPRMAGLLGPGVRAVSNRDAEGGSQAVGDGGSATHAAGEWCAPGKSLPLPSWTISILSTLIILDIHES